jgi:hypothetical protein
MTGPTPAGELFTLPPSFDELAEARERKAQRDDAERKLAARVADAWRRVPAAFRRTMPELLKQIEDSPAQPANRRLLAKVRDLHAIAGVLSGPTGCGKTTAAAVLVRRALAEFQQSNGERCECATDLVWTSAIELALAERRHALGAGEPELLVKARTCGLLVLDDLGLEEPGSVLPILSSRYDWCRATIATTGLGRKALATHLGAAGVRRLLEQHVGMPVGMAVPLIECHDPVKARPVNP